MSNLMNDFEKFIENKDKIKVYNNLQDMTGMGEEYLVDDTGAVRFMFIDGNFVKSTNGGDSEVTYA